MSRLAARWAALAGRLPFSAVRRPTVFHGFWDGPPLGPLRYSCLKSFVELGHQFELYVYGPLDVPRGVVLMDAEQIIPRSEIFYYQNPRIDDPDESGKDLGPFSDLFRFKLLAERGGWWSDVDTICLSPSIPPVERAWASECPEMGGVRIGTSQISFRRGDPVAVELYSRCHALSRTNFSPREALGPMLISRTIHELGLADNEFGSPDRFYPIRWIEMFKLWLPKYRDEVEARCTGALFLPIYQSFIKYIGLSAADVPPRGSYLGEFCARHMPGRRDRRGHRPEEIYEALRAFFMKNQEWAIGELVAVSGEEILRDLRLAPPARPT